MEERWFRKVRLNSSREEEDCECGPASLALVVLTNIVNVLVGQPVVVKLLWITLASSKATDILNVNLALFHNFQYLIATLHVFFLFALPDQHTVILRCLFVLGEIGGTTNLSFICLQRYVAMIYPTFYPLLKKCRYSEVCAVTVWILSVPFAVATVIVEVCDFPVRAQLLDAFQFTLMASMLGMVVQSSITMARTLRKCGPGQNNLHPAKRKAFKTIRATSAIAFFFYIPVSVLERMGNISECVFECVLMPGCIVLLSAASVVHPLFYLFTQGELCTCLKQERKAR